MNRHTRPISGFFKAVWRRCIFVVVLSALMTISPLLSTHLHAQSNETIHIVAAGETLSAIAARYNVNVTTLRAYNNIRDADLIRVGQVIRIPAVVQPISTPTPVGSAGAPAPTVGKSTDPNLTPESASPRVGRPTPTATAGQTTFTSITGYTAQGEAVYTVRRGDTLYGIALRFGVTVSAIMQRNGLRSQVIAVSQLLIIPLPEPRPGPLYNPQITGPNNSGLAPQPTATPTQNSGSGLFLLPTVESTPTPIAGTKLR